MYTNRKIQTHRSACGTQHKADLAGKGTSFAVFFIHKSFFSYSVIRSERGSSVARFMKKLNHFPVFIKNVDILVLQMREGLPSLIWLTMHIWKKENHITR